MLLPLFSEVRQKLMHRVLVRHRLYVWKEGYERLLLQASREELQRLTDVCEYPTMSEAQAVVFHLEAYAARERAAAAKAAAAVSRKRTAHDGAACAGVGLGAGVERGAGGGAPVMGSGRRCAARRRARSSSCTVPARGREAEKRHAR